MKAIGDDLKGTQSKGTERATLPVRLSFHGRGREWPKDAGNGPSLVEQGPTLVEINPDLVDIIANLAESAQVYKDRSNHGRNRAKFCRILWTLPRMHLGECSSNLTECRSDLVEFDQFRRRDRPNLVEIAPTWPKSAQIWPCAFGTMKGQSGDLGAPDYSRPIRPLPRREHQPCSC